MELFKIILEVFAVYFVLMFVVLRLVAPFLGFKQFEIPEVLPKEIKEAVLMLEKTSLGQKDFLENLYRFILNKNSQQWGHNRFKAGTHLHRLFVKDLSDIWNTSNFVYCQAINFLSASMIAGSKFFTARDVRVKHVFLNFVLHQYLQVKINGEWVDFDPAGSGIRGGALGTHVRLLG